MSILYVILTQSFIKNLSIIKISYSSSSFEYYRDKYLCRYLALTMQFIIRVSDPVDGHANTHNC